MIAVYACAILGVLLVLAGLVIFLYLLVRRKAKLADAFKTVALALCGAALLWVAKTIYDAPAGSPQEEYAAVAILSVMLGVLLAVLVTWIARRRG